MRFHKVVPCLLAFAIGLQCCTQSKNEKGVDTDRPNILFAIADDQSYPYASAYGMKGIHTPAFDKVAEKGILFHNAFVAAPQCSPSRAAILTGKNIWELEEAGTHASSFPRKFKVFTNLLERNGYALGFTGKPWSPGNWQIEGWTRNPVGPEFNSKVTDQVPANGINKKDYYGNFADFLDNKQPDEPFFFWYGGHEPHRTYEYTSGYKAGKLPNDVKVPDFLPDDSITRQDIMDYVLEIEYFDSHLLKMLDLLEKRGVLDNTLVVVTADNGMPFPYAKANLQEYGTHVPLAISWPKEFIEIKASHELVSLIDLAPTFLEAAGIEDYHDMTGKSMMPILRAESNAEFREYVLTGRERHTHARPDNLGYPARAIRTKDFLYIKNYAPDRWPVGDPVRVTAENKERAAAEGFKSLFPGYHDIDGSPSKTLMMDKSREIPALFQQAFLKRPEGQLYDILTDPYCINDLSGKPEYAEKRARLLALLDAQLSLQGDPRMFGSEVFDSYPRYSPMRNFEGFNDRGTYNESYRE
jgi:N-sulfoglucosamine sulfohydrolase